MPLYTRPDSPNYYVTIGDDVRESTSVPHLLFPRSKRGTPEEIKAQEAKALEYERTLQDTLWRLHRLGDRSALPFLTATENWLNKDSKARARDRQSLKWLLEVPAPFGPQLGPWAISTIADWDSLVALRDLAAVGRDESTADRIMTTVSAILNFHHPKYLEVQPKVPMFRPTKPERSWLSPEMFARVCSFLPWHLELCARFAVLSLLRHDAMLSLKWPDLNFEARIGTVTRLVQKNVETFSFPITEEMVELLHSIRERQVEQWEDHVRRCKRKKIPTNPDWDWQHVFTWKGVHVKSCNTRAYRTALRLAGAPDDCDWHTLRHTGAAWAMLYGHISLADLMSIGGWKSVASVAPYLHLNVESKRAPSQTVANKMPSLRHARTARARAALADPSRLTIPSHRACPVPGPGGEFPLSDPGLTLVGRVGLEPTTNALKGRQSDSLDVQKINKNKELQEILRRTNERQRLKKAANGT